MSFVFKVLILWGISIVRKLCANCQFKSFIHDVRIVRYTAGSRNRLSTSSLQTFIVQTFRSSWLEREKKNVKNQILSYCTTTLLDLDLLAELRILLKETRKKTHMLPAVCLAVLTALYKTFKLTISA